MKPGNHNFVVFIFLLCFFFVDLKAQEKINLEDLQPTYDDDIEILDSEENFKKTTIKSKKKKVLETKETIVKLRALDKITAKTSDISIEIGKRKKFGYLEIFPKSCTKSNNNNLKDVAAYIQVKDLSDKKGDKVFVFNGWTFSSSRTLRTFDHPVYDLWLTGCENI